MTSHVVSWHYPVCCKIINVFPLCFVIDAYATISDMLKGFPFSWSKTILSFNYELWQYARTCLFILLCNTNHPSLSFFSPSTYVLLCAFLTKSPLFSLISYIFRNLLFRLFILCLNYSKWPQWWNILSFQVSITIFACQFVQTSH